MSKSDFASVSYPLTSLIVPEMILHLVRFGFILVVFYAAELVWQERKTGMAGLIDACPSTAFVQWGARFAALCALIFSLTLNTIVLSVIFQISKHYFVFEWALYAEVIPRAALPLALLAVFALFFQTLIPEKYSAMVASFAFILLFSGVGGNLIHGLVHPMLRYAFIPEPIYSSMASTGYFSEAANWYLAFRASVAVLLAYVTLRFWQRGENGLRLQKGTKAGRFLAVGALVFCACVGAATFYQVNVAHPYTSKERRRDWQEAYERAYFYFVT